MAARHLFVAHSPLALLAAAGAARRQGGRAQLLLPAEFEFAERFERALRHWRDNPFEAVTRLPGTQSPFRSGAGVSAFVRRLLSARERRHDTLAALRGLDTRFEPDAVWVSDEGRTDAAQALRLACERNGRRVGRYLDAGLEGYLRGARTARRWIAESWLAFPAEAPGAEGARVRQALPRAWFTGRDGQRLSVLLAREFRVDRDALSGCSAVLLLPPSTRLCADAALLLRLRRLMEAAQACGRRVALKHDPGEAEPDPAGLVAEGAALVLPKQLPVELLPALLPRAALLAGDASAALLAARWLRPDLVVRELGATGGGAAKRARALLARHGVGPLDETALS